MAEKDIMTARILVVDDVKVNVDLLRSRLERDYFEVFTAADGAEALAILDNEPIDLGLLDIMMPGIDGVEVCHRVKANPALAHIPRQHHPRHCLAPIARQKRRGGWRKTACADRR